MLDRVGFGAGAFVVVMALEQQPVVGLAAGAGLGLQAHQVEAAVQALAVQDEGQFALLHALVGVVDRLPGAAVPGLHRAGAVLAVRDGALEVGIVDRVVLDMRRDVLDGGIERRALAHRPAPQHAVVLQAEVVVQAGAVRLVLLHDEDRRVLGAREPCRGRVRRVTVKSRLAR